MNTQDYRIIMTIASNIAKPTYCDGKLCYLLDLKQFVNAIDNIENTLSEMSNFSQDFKLNIEQEDI